MSSEIVLSYSRNRQTVFDGVLQVAEEFSDDQVRHDLQWMQNYISNQPGGRSLVATIRESVPGPNLAAALVSLLKHVGLVNADGLQHAELVEAVKDHITVAEVSKKRAKKPAAKKIKAPAKKAAK